METLANTVPISSTSAHSTAVTKAFLRELLLAQDSASYISQCKVVAEFEEPAYEGIHQPFLLLVGRDDNPRTLNGCEYIFHRIASEHKRYEVLDHVGHWPCLEADEEVGKWIAQFCEEL